MPTPEPEAQRASLKDELLQAIADPGQFPTADNPKGDRTVSAWSRDAVLDLLTQRGHVLPGAPPAAKIIDDARSFAEQLTLAKLFAQVVRHAVLKRIMTNETEGTLAWLTDYLDGVNHGPIGAPMLWPDQLPRLAMLMRSWGYEPVQVGAANYVKRSVKMELTHGGA